MATQSQKYQVSPQQHEDAVKIAKKLNKPGLTKEQSKQIVQGIEKGIALYKKQHKAKLREQDKQRKRAQSAPVETLAQPGPEADKKQSVSWLPWGLLAGSWLFFILYIFLLK